MSQPVPTHKPPQAGDVTAASEPVVVVRNLRKGYGDGRGGDGDVLRGVSLTIGRGELLGLVGRSGSGKSTLLHILGGLDRGYSGEVQVFGRELKTLSDRELSRLRNEKIGFVFQSFHLLHHVSCLENVLLPSAFMARPRPAAALAEQAREALDRVGLADRAHARPSELSGGQRQRVAIARALLFRPELLLCDEPTGNLDAHTGQQIIDLFCRLNAEGQTMLLVTHELRVAQAAARILRIVDGQLEVGSEADVLATSAPPPAQPTEGGAP